MLPYLPTVFNLLLHRMQDQMKDTKTPKYCRYFLHFITLFSMTYSAVTLYELFETITVGLNQIIILNVWSYNISACCSLDKYEVRQMIVGSTKILLETPVNVNSELFIAVLKYILILIDTEISKNSIRSNSVDDSEVAVDEEAESREFDSTYSKLAYAQLPEVIQSAEVTQCHIYFIQKLVAFCSSHPGQYAPVISQSLDPKLSLILTELLTSQGLTLV